MLILDTNILIAYFGGEEDVIRQIQEWRRQYQPLVISSITECELLSYPKLSEIEEERIEQFLRENVDAFVYDGILARRAALVRRIVPALKLPAAAIAALALQLNAPLVTRNIRDFKKISALEVVGI